MPVLAVGVRQLEHRLPGGFRIEPARQVADLTQQCRGSLFGTLAMGQDRLQVAMLFGDLPHGIHAATAGRVQLASRIRPGGERKAGKEILLADALPDRVDVQTKAPGIGGRVVTIAEQAPGAAGIIGQGARQAGASCAVFTLMVPSLPGDMLPATFLTVQGLSPTSANCSGNFSWLPASATAQHDLVHQMPKRIIAAGAGC